MIDRRMLSGGVPHAHPGVISLPGFVLADPPVPFHQVVPERRQVSEYVKQEILARTGIDLDRPLPRIATNYPTDTFTLRDED